MAGVVEAKLNRFRETEDKRFNFEVKKLRTKHNKQVAKETRANESMTGRMRRENEVKIVKLRNELEKNLAGLRIRQKAHIKIENERLTQEVTNLKASHGEQVNEIKNTNHIQLSNINESHKQTLDLASLKFEKEKSKYEVES